MRYLRQFLWIIGFTLAGEGLLRQQVAELAEKLNIRRQTVSAYEREVSIPDIYTLIRIADIFSVSLDELAGRNSAKKKKP